jgi:hypothetical protein
MRDLEEKSFLLLIESQKPIAAMLWYTIYLSYVRSRPAPR